MSRNLQKIILEQQLELERMMQTPVLERLPMKKVDVESPLAQAVLGMRRSGKSVVCRQAMKASGVKFGYVDFDDEALAKLDAGDLDDVLQTVYAVYGQVDHFLFDEIKMSRAGICSSTDFCELENTWSSPARTPAC